MRYDEMIISTSSKKVVDGELINEPPLQITGKGDFQYQDGKYILDKSGDRVEISAKVFFPLSHPIYDDAATVEFDNRTFRVLSWVKHKTHSIMTLQ